MGQGPQQGRKASKSASACKNSGLVDFLNVIRGHIEHDAPLADVIPVMGMQAAPHLDFAGEVRAATKFPVFHAARINDVATARHAIAEGKLDMVGMTRAHIADPHIVQEDRWKAARHDIRPCVGATYCLDRIYEGHERAVHPQSGDRPRSDDAACHRADRRRRARRSPSSAPALPGSKRRASRPSAAMRSCSSRPRAIPAARSAWRPRSSAARELIGIADWRAEQCERLGVDAEVQHLCRGRRYPRRSSPTSSSSRPAACRRTCAIDEGAELAVSSWDILSGDVKPAEDVLLFDDNGAHPGMAAAEFIADAGAKLELVSPERFFAPEMGGLNLVPYMQTFTDKDVTDHDHDAGPRAQAPGQQDQG